MPPRLSILVLCLGLALSPPVTYSEVAPPAPLAKYDISKDIFSPVHAMQGMVASEQKLASNVGVDILKRGGNAVEAAAAPRVHHQWMPDGLWVEKGIRPPIVLAAARHIRRADSTPAHGH